MKGKPSNLSIRFRSFISPSISGAQSCEFSPKMSNLYIPKKGLKVIPVFANGNCIPEAIVAKASPEHRVEMARIVRSWVAKVVGHPNIFQTLEEHYGFHNAHPGYFQLNFSR
ncbi:hypothetical protein VOLCADRAFT_92765 [Volvox carteri f. nagariensis]|uniref:Uncharacterized protein n=1 Tax=Volvox carteri f. nagariensis TaxID=3068 RepID=D8U0W8_VOLCA|nr:uncharacterized protein VOLCADRAFT_92765 [Volvox carteri f. nagariensis]EFJ46710.1 hypothetical protein VOLCADRAFT_92765 [Volvox carteri f. nagariensis]|eukprot:XP_002952239.1 hypothetical protein VOLCADRAFT_92765 [Volvox carteri f. nagariensis]